MGIAMFTKSGMFYPADYGLNQGDTVDVVLVGSGGHGDLHAELNPGDGAGTDSSFGTYAVAKSAFGAKGGFGWTAYDAPRNAYKHVGGGGGGGYVPGAPFQGGCGLAPPASTVANIVLTMQGNGGGARQFGYQGQATSFVGGGGSNFGGGNATFNHNSAEGGAGYGAGGGAAATVDANNSNDTQNNGCGGYGGQILYHSHVLTKEDVENGIPITVGCAAIYFNYLGSYTFEEYDNHNNVKTWPTLNSGWVSQLYPQSMYLKEHLQRYDILREIYTINGGPYGIQPVCSFQDGSVIFMQMSPSNAYGSLPGINNQSYLYSGVTKKIYTFSESFPEFSKSIISNRRLVYRVGDYFVQYYTAQSGSGDGNYVTFRCIPAEKALTGTATKSDVIRVDWVRPGSNTGSLPFGFDAAGGLICNTDKNSYAYWPNWTPQSDPAAYTTKVVDNEFHNHSDTQCVWIPVGERSAVLVRHSYSTDGYSTSSLTNYLADPANGVQSATEIYYMSVVGYCQGTDIVYRSVTTYVGNGYVNQIYLLDTMDIHEKPYYQKTNHTATARICVDGEWREYRLNTVAASNNNNNGGYTTAFMWPTIDSGWVVIVGNVGNGSSAPTNPSSAFQMGAGTFLRAALSSDMPTFGYDNAPGCPGAVKTTSSTSFYGESGKGGGAGGCCQITW